MQSNKQISLTQNTQVCSVSMFLFHTKPKEISAILGSLKLKLIFRFLLHTQHDSKIIFYAIVLLNRHHSF